MNPQDFFENLQFYKPIWSEKFDRAKRHFEQMKAVKINGIDATLIFPDTFEKDENLTNLIVADRNAFSHVDMTYNEEQNRQIGVLKPLGYKQNQSLHIVLQVRIVADLPCRVSLYIGEDCAVKTWELDRDAKIKEHFNFSLLAPFQKIYFESTAMVPDMYGAGTGVKPKRNPNTQIRLYGVLFGDKTIPHPVREHIESCWGMLPPIYFTQSDILCADTQGLLSDGKFKQMARYGQQNEIERERDRWRFKEDDDEERKRFIF